MHMYICVRVRNERFIFANKDTTTCAIFSADACIYAYSSPTYVCICTYAYVGIHIYQRFVSSNNDTMLSTIPVAVPFCVPLLVLESPQPFLYIYQRFVCPCPIPSNSLHNSCTHTSASFSSMTTKCPVPY